MRVWPDHCWGNGVPAERIPDANEAARWILVEWRADGTIKYALSNLFADATLDEAVPLSKERWQVDRGYLRLMDELGFDRFERRRWPGFHDHAAMAFLVLGFLDLERRRAGSTVP